jgi:hypothetical protein
MSGGRYRREGNRLEAGAGGNQQQLGMFVAEPEAPLIGLRVKVDRRLIAINRAAATSAASVPARDRMRASDLRRLRPAPRLDQQNHCTLDRERDLALRRADHAHHGARSSHLCRGGAAPEKLITWTRPQSQLAQH